MTLNDSTPQHDHQPEKAYDFLVFIGRFQPFHLGHLSVVQAALQQAEHLIVLCGSAHQSPSVRNPWTVTERANMIHASLPAGEQRRVHIAPLMDVMYNDEAWVRNVQATVQGLVTAHYATPHRTPRIGLIGHSKDHSAYYLRLFPQWGSLEVPNLNGINATPIREALFGIHTDPNCMLSGSSFLASEQAQTQLPETVREQLALFCQSERFTELQAEQAFVAKYKQAWSSAPYPPTFVTVDAVVVQSGHVLLVERRARPGKGLYALPGGFIGAQESLVDACLRELREETKLTVPLPVLKGSIRAERIFDDPHRSARGRTLTYAFYLELSPSETLPKVKGASDARKAFWQPLAALKPAELFEDHYFIIQTLTGT